MLRIIFLLWYCSLSLSYAAEITLRDSDLIAYADSLFQQEEYYRAISEYKRYLYYFPLGAQVDHAQYQIARSYAQGGAHRLALDYLSTLQTQKMSAESRFSLGVLEAGIFFRRDRALPFALREGHIQKGMAALQNLPADYPGSGYYQSFLQDWQKRPQENTKSPLLAGTLSTLLPGSGSLYVGRRKEALYSFMVVALFAWAASDAFASDQNELGYVLGFFGLSFYAGNIYASANSAHRYNNALQHEHFESLLIEYGLHK